MNTNGVFPAARVMELNLDKVPVERCIPDGAASDHAWKNMPGVNTSPQMHIPIWPAKLQDDKDNGGKTGGSSTGVATRTKTRTKKPNLYRVLLLNDDFTPMEFVVHVLERFFSKSREQATQIMLHVHQHGVGECGVFTYEVAETKVTQVMDFARKHQHPLQCVMEKN